LSKRQSRRTGSPLSDSVISPCIHWFWQTVFLLLDEGNTIFFAPGAIFRYFDLLETMKLSEIQKMRERVPFRPFAVYLANGDVLPVDHPELLSISPQVNDLFSLWVGKQWNLVDVENVSRISVLTKAEKAR
jgi:hypothetical protein